MDPISEKEERLREAASIADIDTLKALCMTVNVNSQNKMNGWTALHWAAKRNHPLIVETLLMNGADKNIVNNNGELAANLSKNAHVLQLLGHDIDPNEKVESMSSSNLPITPNYIANPPFPYGSESKTVETLRGMSSSESRASNSGGNLKKSPPQPEHELVLKARVAHMEETDFIEVELDRQKLTYSDLVQLLCAELNVDSKLIHKVRKCPNTILRKDKDVARLCDFQEVELVLSNRLKSPLIRTYGDFNGVGAKIKQEQILY